MKMEEEWMGAVEEKRDGGGNRRKGRRETVVGIYVFIIN